MGLSKVVLLLALMAVAAFCAFGFLATFEPGDTLLWRVGYGLSGLACLGAGLMLMRSRARDGDDQA